ncbi:hypothetical protein D8Y22_09650 [Salinadaptatus halalkaliphilus]|uniref:Antitoxin n=1 Tax=Salinadaptatus halalkaliphilus TaxID=2419781 RepID=A0A4S3TMG5_9EURY|nr:antitoxin VapB family protein [Salinadaptatus halalkaliphilus]THE65429.1 hypothetical protein D8Y22_09650 [Salinadaptatus halalkaliphilus]
MSQQIRLEDDVYERIKASKRDNETFSDAVARLIDGRSLRDLRDVFDDEQVREMRNAIDVADHEESVDLKALREETSDGAALSELVDEGRNERLD